LQVGGSVTDLVIRECTFDGGTVGFSRYHAIDGGGGIVTALNMENVTFLRGADAAFVQSTTGWVAGVTSTESALISFNEDDPA
jgi:hypothetical protein